MFIDFNKTNFVFNDQNELHYLSTNLSAIDTKYVWHYNILLLLVCLPLGPKWLLISMNVNKAVVHVCEFIHCISRIFRKRFFFRFIQSSNYLWVVGNTQNNCNTILNVILFYHTNQNVGKFNVLYYFPSYRISKVKDVKCANL